LDHDPVPGESRRYMLRLYEIHRDGTVVRSEHAGWNLDHAREERRVADRARSKRIHPAICG